MSLGKRSFASILLKQNNTEVKKQVNYSKSDYNDRPQSSSSFYSEATLVETVDSIDLEDYLNEQKDLIKKDNQKQLLDFPYDDIEVCVVPRKLRTIKPILPDYGDLTDQEDLFINDCLNSFTCNWIVVSRRYENKSLPSERKEERYIIARNFPRLEYEIDNESDEGSDDGSSDKTPNAVTPATISALSYVNGFNNNNCTSKPPLASDEDTSDDSITPPLTRYCSIDATNIDTHEISHRNSTLIDDTESGNSWHYIDSPCNSIVLDNKFSRNSTISITSKTSRASRIFDLKNSQSDPLVSEVLNATTIEEIDKLNERRRAENRYAPIFLLYPLEDESYIIENRPPVIPPKELLGYRFLVKCLSLKLDLEIEPIFASIALYDAKERKKVSENFYFDLNSENIKKMLSAHIPYQDISTLSRSCIFNITNPTSDMFLVIKLEKVLQGDVNESFDHYAKEEKNKERLKSNAITYCERLGKYRQLFAWTAVYLMDVLSGHNNTLIDPSDISSLDRKSFTEITRKKPESSSLSRKESLERVKADKRRSWSNEEICDALSTFQPVTLKINNFYKYETDRFRDEDMFKFLLDLKRSASLLKRLKSIPCLLKLDISPCLDEQLKYCLTTELEKLYPYPDDKGRPIKELLEFPLKEIYHPNYHYRNILFVYPKSLNFTSRQGSARNITCKIQLMSGENEFSALPVIFGKSGCPEFTCETYTSITYHNKSPDFNDEIKIKLPAKLNEQHHLLFTFYHISCQKIKTNDTNAVETPIGYTWLPIFRDGRLQTGPFGLPVMMEKPPASYSFLTPSIQIPNTRWVDNHKDVFTICLETTSTLHSQDIHLDYFLRLSTLIEEQNIPPRLQGTNIENEFKSSILAISSANLEPLIKFFPLVMNKLVKLLVRPPSLGGNHVLNIGQTVFEAIASILKKVSSISDNCNRNNLLTTFVQYQCLFPHPDILPARLLHLLDGHQENRNHIRSNSIPNVSIDSQRTQPSLERACSLRNTQQQSAENNIHSMGKGFVPLRKLFHEELLLQWVVASGQAKELALYNSWVFFDLIIKSATENLALTGGFSLARKERFTEQFRDDLKALVVSLSSELVNRMHRDRDDMKLIHNLNNSLAFFIRDLWSIADRGFVFTLIKFYCNQVSTGDNGPDSMHAQFLGLKLDFLRIICNYEHFVTLNLPFNTPLFPTIHFNGSSTFSLNSQNSIISTLSLLDRIGAYSELSDEYRKRHFLVGLALSSFSLALEINNASIHHKAINLIRSVLTSHDWDQRFVEKDVKSRVCSLYLPFLGVVIDALPQLYDWKTDFPNSRALYKRKDDKRKPIIFSSTDDIDSEITINSIDQNIGMAISGSNVYNKQLDGFVQTSYEPRRWPLREEATKDLLICFIWVLKHTSNNLFRRWLSEQSLDKVSQLVDLLDICVSCFEYKGKKAVKDKTLTLKKATDLKSKLEDAILGFGSARRDLIMRRRDRTNCIVSQSFSHNDALRWKKDSFNQTRYNNGSLRFNKNRIETEREVILNGHLICEVIMTILDTIENIIYVLCQDMDISSDYYKQCQSLVGSILQVIIHCLSTNQSTQALQNIFSTQRSLLIKFPNLLFEERLDRELLSELFIQLLRHCSSSISAVRAQAASSLYLLMRQNFKSSSNFARIKMQITMSLSSLVGTNQKFSEQYLRRSLKTILIYAVEDKDYKDSNFAEQVRNLVFNLHMILSDTIRMKEYQEDPEMLIDLMYRIAKGYQHSPDLRLTWLANMAAKHNEKGNHAEAAQCFIHSAAMVAEYLYLINSKPYLPVSCISFQKISSNILEESTVSSEVPADKDGLFTGKSFSESGLVVLLEKASNSFAMAGMYETVNEVYKLLLPIAESHRDYKKLASIHGKLQDIFNKIELLNSKRVFGTYFRVGFYGSRFGDLDREEFVYKEPCLTKLPEIAHRLESFYTEQLGPGSVEVIKDSNTVDLSKCDPDKAYLQITYVEPYFDPWELEQRPSFFERSYNIKRFIYSTPFTTDGRAHGDLHEQYKRKTILTTVNSFPYLKTRILVADRQQIVLSPIEVAIDDIQKKTCELASVTHQDPIDPKILQMVLQGCIGTTVNQGPLEVANVFLSESSKILKQRPPSPLQNKLRSCFKDFCRKCGDALRKNRTLIGVDQKEYQRGLEQNYYNFTEKLAPMISTNGQAALKSLRETYWNPSSTNKFKLSPNVLSPV